MPAAAATSRKISRQQDCFVGDRHRFAVPGLEVRIAGIIGEIEQTFEEKFPWRGDRIAFFAKENRLPQCVQRFIGPDFSQHAPTQGGFPSTSRCDQNDPRRRRLPAQDRERLCKLGLSNDEIRYGLIIGLKGRIEFIRHRQRRSMTCTSEHP